MIAKLSLCGGVTERFPVDAWCPLIVPWLRYHKYLLSAYRITIVRWYSSKRTYVQTWGKGRKEKDCRDVFITGGEAEWYTKFRRMIKHHEFPNGWHEGREQTKSVGVFEFRH